jgi:hypothetical protein
MPHECRKVLSELDRLVPDGHLSIIIVRKRLRMNDTVEVSIPVEPEAAAALADPRTRESIGRLISRVLRRRPGPSSLAEALADAKAAARASGLTDEDVDAELAAYNTERRDQRRPD